MMRPGLSVVVLNTGTRLLVYGPVDGDEAAEEFARFLTAEVDPATVYPLLSPMLELLAFWKGQKEPEPPAVGFPEYWPPKHGDIWQDQNLDRWSCQQDGTLACLARKADDAPYEINRVCGPMTLVYRPDATEKEVPF